MRPYTVTVLRRAIRLPLSVNGEGVGGRGQPAAGASAASRSPSFSITVGSSSVPRMRQSSPGARIFSADRMLLYGRLGSVAGGSMPFGGPSLL